MGHRRVVAALVAAAVLGGCAGSPPDDAGTTAPAIDHHGTDVTFLQIMIPHHTQALGLAALVPTRTANAELIALAQRIEALREPEIQGFRAQLLQWQAPLDAPPGTPVDGMVAAATMEKLTGLRGTDFDTLWLQAMIAHHRGAIAMARTEIDRGHSADIISLARSIATAQQAEVDQMNRMLGG